MRILKPRLSVLLATVFALGACSDEETTTCKGNACPGSPGAPIFAGVTTVAPNRAGDRIRVTWSPATDDKTPTEQIRYRVYVSTRSGKATTRPAALTTEPGASSTYVSVSPIGVTHFVTVRAVDGDNLEDGNTIQKSVLATGDTTPPTFGGAKAARSEPNAGVTVSWDPATDDRTPSEALRYAVYAGSTATTPLAILDGNTEVTLRSLGLPGEKRSFFVVALDAADNAAGTDTSIEGTIGPDTTPPMFSGCKMVEVLGSTLVRVSWQPADDELSPDALTSYEVFSATASGAQDFANPIAKVTAQTSVLLRGLQPGTQYHFVCRARDAAGNVDTNTVEKLAVTKSNVTPPTFGGVTGSFDGSARTVTLTWTAATDDVTATDKIVYAVYQAKDSQPFDFQNPQVVTPPGATSIDLIDLPSRTTLRWVVRARDEDYNEDANVTELTGTTSTSFSLDVLPFFAKNCAVVGCHAFAQSAGALSLSTFNAYESIVDVTAAQKAVKRVEPGDSANSYLYQKMILVPPDINGNPMPAPGTGTVLTENEKDIIKTWIDEGAIRN